ncbi:MAG: pyridoxal phosphate-dependent aminotransferase [Myxococcota bacterium]|nr:pyridoxal phosphate-dependent aminotransferase [Myxococcota bacterium]
MEIVARARSLRPFLAMEVFERAQALERAGADVLHLEVGEPAFPPPEAAVVEAIRALQAGQTRYTDSRGLLALRQEIARDKHARSGVSVDPECVLVTSGTSPALMLVFSLLLSPGDEVLIPAPHYPCYPNFARFCGAVPVPVETRAKDGFRIDPRKVEAALTPRTRAIVIGSPANPTGAVQSKGTLRELAGLGVPLISDEIYDGIVYDGDDAPSALADREAGDVFVLDGFSKRHAMTGFRLGYVIAPEEAIRSLQIAHQNLAISASEFVQRAGIAVLKAGLAEVRARRDVYRERRDLLVTGLRALGFGVPVAPAGAFYVLADARAFGSDSVALAGRLLEEASVAVAPGVDFGDSGEGFLRLSYAASTETLADALERMAPVLDDLRA